MQKKIITVFGATGAQGGGLVRAILNDPKHNFVVRAVTRNASSAKAIALKNAGCEVVEGNIDDEASILEVMKDAYAAFCVTFFWEHFSADKEVEQARKMARASKDSKLKHVIWSTLEDVRKWIPIEDNRMPTLQGKYKVPHFDGKGEADKFFQEAGTPVTLLKTSFFWENFIYFGMGPRKISGDQYVLSLPLGKSKLAGIGAEDVGKCAYAIFQDPGSIGKTIGISGEHCSGETMAKTLGDVLQKEISYETISPDTYRSIGFPGSEDLGNMFQFNTEFEDVCLAARNVEESRKLNPEIKSFRQWCEENASRIPL